MAKPEGEHPHHDDVNHANADSLGNASDDDDDNRSSDSDSGSDEDEQQQAPLFPQFASLPPELRAQIWRAAVDTTASAGAPGINFFNVHTFPGDHPGANRSTSPPWLYFDVRRLAIEHSDAEAARYDPSVWQTRAAVAATCREARYACQAAAIPEDKSIIVTLTRPRRGLFVRAGDGQLRRLTPPHAGNYHGGGDGGSGFIYQEPKVTRKITVHADEMLCLSLENCSFNMPCEENSGLEPPSPAPAPALENHVMAFAAGAGAGTAAYDEAETGWTYDPQLTPLPSNVNERVLPKYQYCVSVARGEAEALSVVEGIVPGMLGEIPGEIFDWGDNPGENESGHENQDGGGHNNEPASAYATTTTTPAPSPPPPRDRPWYEHQDGWLIMVDACVEKLGSRSLSELLAETRAGMVAIPPPPLVYRDRFDDAYALLRSPHTLGHARLPKYFLTKVAPERTDVRLRYLQSAQLRSPKRPVASVLS